MHRGLPTQEPEVLNIWAKLGLTRHGWVLNKCESNLNCFKEKSAYHVFRQSCLPSSECSQQKLSMQVENMLTAGKKKKKIFPRHLLWLLDKGGIWVLWVFITWRQLRDSRPPFQIDPQLPRISAFFPPFLEVFAPPFSADSMGPCSWTPWKSPTEKEQLPWDLYSLKHHVIP